MNYQKLLAYSQDQPDSILKVNYPVHFRYQSPAETEYVNSPLFMKTRFFSNCSFINLFENDTFDNPFFNEKVASLFGPGFQKIRLRHFADEKDLKKGQMSDILFAPIPVGDITLQRPMLYLTLIITLFFAILIFRTIKASPSPIDPTAGEETKTKPTPGKKKAKKD